MRIRPATYLCVFGFAGALAFAAGWMGWWATHVLACPPAPPGTFLAYCRDERYGDFEHGALLFGLEAAAVRQAQRADVIVIGDSRAQFGFSTEATRRYFATRGWSYYLLGMGYGSTSAYAQALLRRHDLRPRALIVNADPFFTNDSPSVVGDVLRGDARTIWSYRRKWLFHPLHQLACDRVSRWCGGTGGIHRRIENGEWIWDGVLVAGHLATPFVDRALPVEQQEASERVAVAFVGETGLDARCVIMTDVPGVSAESRRVANAIAAAVGAPAVLPVVDGLSSLDGDHLNALSAERWSAAFFVAADQQLAGCLTADQGPTARPRR